LRGTAPKRRGRDARDHGRRTPTFFHERNERAGTLGLVKLRAFALASLLFAVSAPRLAHAVEAPTDCPPGSTGKVNGTFAFCEPSVCLHDGNCAQGEVCRTVPLCVEVGTLADSGQKGEDRLMATQRCGAGGACPSSQTCSTKERCLSKAQAQKLGLLEAPAASSASATPSAAEPKKSSCGCEVPGPAGASLGPFALALGVLGVALGRRRAPR